MPSSLLVSCIKDQSRQDRTVAFLARSGILPLIASRKRIRHRAVEAFGLTFANPLGVAAGCDRGGEALMAWWRWGYGHCEVGPVVPYARMAEPGAAAAEVRERLESFRFDHDDKPLVIGINLAAAAVASADLVVGDHVAAFRRLYDVGDYFVVNAFGGEDAGGGRTPGDGQLVPLFDALQEWNEFMIRKPILVRIPLASPAGRLDQVIDLHERGRIAGIIVSAARSEDDRSISVAAARRYGDMPVLDRMIARLQELRRRTAGACPLVADGGVNAASDLPLILAAGASLVSLPRACVLSRPRLVRDLFASLPPAETAS